MESVEEEQEIASFHLIKQIARMTAYKVNDATDWQDAVDTLNGLIRSAKRINRMKGPKAS